MLLTRTASRLARIIKPVTTSVLYHQDAARSSTLSGESAEMVRNVRLVRATDPKYNSVELELEDAESLRIPLVWLRDHCRSETCYNQTTNQRYVDTTSLFSHSTLASSGTPFTFDRKNQTVSLTWEDGHKTSFHIKELMDWAVFTRKDYDECASRTYWNSTILKEIPSVSSRNFDFATFARLFVRFGLVSVVGVEYRNERATKKLCEMVAPYHDTFFGQFWIFGSQESIGKHEDRAFGDRDIGFHTDGTYLDQPPGIQVIHCLRTAKTGGENVFVDGYAAAEQLRKERPDLFQVLSTTPVEHHFLETSESVDSNDPNDFDDYFEQATQTTGLEHDDKPELHARSVSKCVIECFKHKVIQVRFNPYDRAPLRTLRVLDLDAGAVERNVEMTVAWYEAYEKFSQILHNSSNQLQMTLQPGTVVFVDNTRIIHARKAFVGNRKMCGCYLSRDAMLARARPLLTSPYYKHI